MHLFPFLTVIESCVCIINTQIHWFSIFNSFMMVIFLTGLVSMILMRTLRNDYAKYAREDDDLETLVVLFSLIYILYFFSHLLMGC
jgi:hypothetical protein